MKKFNFALAALLLLAPAGAHAATGTANFSGTIAAICILTSGAAGVITPNSTYTTLSSTNTGGFASTLTAISTGTAFTVATDAPTGITADTLSSSYSLSGSTSASNVSGSTQTTLNAGTTAVSVNMVAAKTSGNFASGNYAATVTVRCE